MVCITFSLHWTGLADYRFIACNSIHRFKPARREGSEKSVHFCLRTTKEPRHCSHSWFKASSLWPPLLGPLKDRIAAKSYWSRHLSKVTCKFCCHLICKYIFHWVNINNKDRGRNEVVSLMVGTPMTTLSCHGDDVDTAPGYFCPLESDSCSRVSGA